MQPEFQFGPSKPVMKSLTSGLTVMQGLPVRYSSCRLVRLPMLSGSSVSWLPVRYSFCRFSRLPMLAGSSVSWLPKRYSCCRF